MTGHVRSAEERESLVQRIADHCTASGTTVAVAESLTCGKVAAALAAGENASDWLRGGVVAYAPDVKFQLLGVTPGPVVTEQCAREMAEGVRALLTADLSVSSTGVGGPDPDEGRPPGTLFVATCAPGTSVHQMVLEGGPEAVVEAAVDAALAHLAAALDDAVSLTAPPPPPT